MGGRLEGESGLRGAVPWGMGQSLWVLVSKSGKKKDKELRKAQSSLAHEACSSQS